MPDFGDLEFKASATAAWALVAALVDELEPDARARVIAAAEAKVPAADTDLSNESYIRDRSIDRIRALR
jgi:hypothetical protein